MKKLRFGLKPLSKSRSGSAKLKSIFALKPICQPELGLEPEEQAACLRFLDIDAVEILESHWKLTFTYSDDSSPCANAYIRIINHIDPEDTEEGWADEDGIFNAYIFSEGEDYDVTVVLNEDNSLTAATKVYYTPAYVYSGQLYINDCGITTQRIRVDIKDGSELCNTAVEWSTTFKNIASPNDPPTTYILTKVLLNTSDCFAYDYPDEEIVLFYDIDPVYTDSYAEITIARNKEEQVD